ncbi:MAG TPA: DUF835 domain-containing protein [Euryarchaeota archaeon]|nr:DUF835 domain-containing protein [Euryarchaeota archaeon]
MSETITSGNRYQGTIEYEPGLRVVKQQNGADLDKEFDLTIASFGGAFARRSRCNGRFIRVTISEVPDAVDPRDLEQIKNRISRLIEESHCSEIGLSCIETLLAWNNVDAVVAMLYKIDEMLRSNGSRGRIVLNEALIAPDEYSLILGRFAR